MVIKSEKKEKRMELKKLKIEISDDLLELLQEASKKENLSSENYAAQLLEKALKKEKATPSLPSVALLKNGFNPGISTSPNLQNTDQIENSSAKGLLKGAPGPARTSEISPERVARQKAVEEQMKEISLLIDTAESEEKKNEYVQTYAQLAAELEALL
jgi:hypothetical protein